MRRIYLIIPLLFIAQLSFCQQVTFNDTFRLFGSGGDGFDNIVKDSNNYFTLGYIYDGLHSSPHIVQFNEYGQVIQKRKYEHPVYNYTIYPYNSLINNRNALIFCGQVRGDSIGVLGFIMCVNKNTLDTLWTRTYSHPDTLIAQNSSNVFSVLSSIKSTPDGNFILTGNYNKNCVTGNLRSFLMKIDSAGNVIWRKTYDDIYGLYDVEVTSTSGFVFINKNWGAHVVETDSIGSIIWQKKINNYTLNATVSDLTNTGSNSFVGIVKYLSGGTISNPIYGLNVFKINLYSQQITWDKTYQIYSDLQCISMHQAMGVQTRSNGNILVSGTTQRFGFDAFVFNLSTNGDSLWTKTYDFGPDPWDCQLNDLILTDDGGYLGVGFFSDQNGPGWTAWMFKTDSNGVINSTNELVIDDQQQLVKCFPNPATTYINIEWNSDLPSEPLLEVYSSMGIMIHREMLSGNKNIINVSNWSPGMYFHKLQFDDRATSGKFLVN